MTRVQTHLRPSPEPNAVSLTLTQTLTRLPEKAKLKAHIHITKIHHKFLLFFLVKVISFWLFYSLSFWKFLVTIILFLFLFLPPHTYSLFLLSFSQPFLLSSSSPLSIPPHLLKCIFSYTVYES